MKDRTIAIRATSAAQQAISEKMCAKRLLKEERHRVDVPAYYLEVMASLVAKSSDLSAECAGAALAALEYAKVGNGKTSLSAANFLAKSSSHHVSAAKKIREALALCLTQQQIE